MELQGLKRETLAKEQGKLTADQEFQISTIQVRSRSDYDRAVEKILAEKK